MSGLQTSRFGRSDAEPDWTKGARNSKEDIPILSRWTGFIYLHNGKVDFIFQVIASAATAGATSFIPILTLKELIAFEAFFAV